MFVFGVHLGFTTNRTTCKFPVLSNTLNILTCYITQLNAKRLENFAEIDYFL